MAEQLLNDSVTVTLNASGAGTASIGPDSAKGPARWRITRIGVVNTNTARRGKPPIPTCNVFVDSETLDNLIDGSYDGSFDFTDCDLVLGRGQVVIAVWAGGQSGDRMALSVTGTKE